MAEWSNAAVLKTVDLNGSGGSNPSLSASSLDYQANTHNVHDYVHEMTDFSVIFRFPAYQKTTPGCPGAVAKITSSIHHDVITRGKYTNLFE